MLISGAGVAGLTLSFWLNKFGYDVSIIEMAGVLRRKGSPVDIKGPAVPVAREMNVLASIRSREIRTQRVVFVDSEDRALAEVDPSQLHDEPGEDVEIQREDLIDILYESVKEEVRLIYNSSIVKVEQTDDQVNVVFTDGSEGSYNLLLGADGLHSNVRKIVFGSEERFTKFYGMYAGVVEIDEKYGEENSCTLFNESGKMAGIYNFKGKANAILVFHSPDPVEYDHRNTDQKKEILYQFFSSGQWKIGRILETFRNAEDFYFDSIAQVRMNSWTHHRTALVGDAAYCASFLTGRGTSLAMIGAYELARALQESAGDHTLAFRKYEMRLRPLVKKYQSDIKGGALFLVPRTKLQILIRNKMTLIMPFLARIGRLFQRRD